MPYNFVADSFRTKKLCSRLSSREVRFYTEKGRSIQVPLNLDATPMSEIQTLATAAEYIQGGFGSKRLVS